MKLPSNRERDLLKKRSLFYILILNNSFVSFLLCKIKREVLWQETSLLAYLSTDSILSFNDSFVSSGNLITCALLHVPGTAKEHLLTSSFPVIEST